LKPGDHIVLGGSSEILFDHVSEEKEAEKEGLIDEPSAADFPNIPVGDALRQAPSLASASSPSPAAGSRTMLMVAGGAVLLAVVVVGVTGAIYYRSRSSACDAKAKITKPEAGETIYAATEIEVEIDDPGCIAKAIYTVDGVEFASSEDAPFTVALDPKEHPDLADGFDHSFGGNSCR
jgi:hypothetical protein